MVTIRVCSRIRLEIDLDATYLSYLRLCNNMRSFVVSERIVSNERSQAMYTNFVPVVVAQDEIGIHFSIPFMEKTREFLLCIRRHTRVFTNVAEMEYCPQAFLDCILVSLVQLIQLQIQMVFRV